MSNLVLVRHGESVWNEKGWWTGLTDIGLTEKGIDEAKKAGKLIADIPFDCAYTSTLIRAKDSLTTILNTLHQQTIPVFAHAALNERDYGIYTGRNKWEIKKEVGDEKFLKLRRGWDEPIPYGETLKDVYLRVFPYYRDVISLDIATEKNVLVVAHGNSLRALIKHLEAVPNENISSIEMKTGEVYVYQLTKDGTMLHKDIRVP